MTREEITTTLFMNIAKTLPDVETDKIDPSRTMKELGANSLDMVEIVSRTMRQLKVKVSRSELNSAENIGALIDLIERAAQR